MMDTSAPVAPNTPPKARPLPVRLRIALAVGAVALVLATLGIMPSFFQLWAMGFGWARAVGLVMGWLVFVGVTVGIGVLLYAIGASSWLVSLFFLPTSVLYLFRRPIRTVGANIVGLSLVSMLASFPALFIHLVFPATLGTRGFFFIWVVLVFLAATYLWRPTTAWCLRGYVNQDEIGTYLLPTSSSILFTLYFSLALFYLILNLEKFTGVRLLPAEWSLVAREVTLEALITFLGFDAAIGKWQEWRDRRQGVGPALKK